MLHLKIFHIENEKEVSDIDLIKKFLYSEDEEDKEVEIRELKRNLLGF